MKIYKTDYYGYVYLWYDRKRKMFCLGSHYGSAEDSYITSTGKMQDIYKKRPEDFKRRILEYIKIDSKHILHQQEQRWLNMIRLRDLSTKQNIAAETNRYYNVKAIACGGDHITRPLVAITCCICKNTFMEKYKSRKKRTCSKTCFKKLSSKRMQGKNNSFYGKTHDSANRAKISNANSGKPAWNKGGSNPLASENGKKGAEAQRQTVTGRKREYRNNGSWFWVYPNRNGA